MVFWCRVFFAVFCLLHRSLASDEGHCTQDLSESRLGSFKSFLFGRVRPNAEPLRILVTGGAGFVGSHLVDRLLLDGNRVAVVDNYYTGTPDNLLHWQGFRNFELQDFDVEQPIRMNVDQIYHLASPASPPSYMADSVRTIKTNVLGSINILELAKQTGARVLLGSTSEVYGDPQQHPQTESYWGNVNPVGPRACYDESKRVSETLFTAYHEQYDVDIRIARIFNTYGPRMQVDDGRVISNFVTQSILDRPLTVYGDGNQTRSFQYVSDLVEGLVRLMNMVAYPGPVNLGTSDEWTVTDLASKVQELSVERGMSADQLLPVEHHSLPVDDPQRRRPDTNLAKSVLDGWHQTVGLEKGLGTTFDYFRCKLRADQAAEIPCMADHDFFVTADKTTRSCRP